VTNRVFSFLCIWRLIQQRWDERRAMECNA
jgi:hypothetical protein